MDRDREAGVQGKERVGRGVRAIILISDILYYPYTQLLYIFIKIFLTVSSTRP